MVGVLIVLWKVENRVVIDWVCVGGGNLLGEVLVVSESWFMIRY